VATKDQVINLVKRACAYYERKTPSPYTLDEWSEELEGLDLSEPKLVAIMHRLKEMELWPKNFPGTVRHIYGGLVGKKKNFNLWNKDEIVKSYARDYYEGLEADAMRNGIEILTLAEKELAKPLLSRGLITQARYDWLMKASEGWKTNIYFNLDKSTIKGDPREVLEKFQDEFGRLSGKVVNF
jgi:hypothetical protein